MENKSSPAYSMFCVSQAVSKISPHRRQAINAQVVASGGSNCMGMQAHSCQLQAWRMVTGRWHDRLVLLFNVMSTPQACHPL